MCRSSGEKKDSREGENMTSLGGRGAQNTACQPLNSEKSSIVNQSCELWDCLVLSCTLLFLF